MKQRVFNIPISFAVGVLGVVQVLPYLREDEPPEMKVVHIVNEKQPDFFSKSPQEGLMEALEYYGVKHHRYKPLNDYYKFLSDIGYAEDPDYINKLKGIVSRNDKRRSE